MTTENLFKGIAIVIDDEIENPTSEICTIKGQLEGAGGFVVACTQLPARDADLEHFAGAAFVLLDWNLIGTAVGGTEALGMDVPQTLKAQNADDICDFLLKLRSKRFVPVFIFTNETVETVKSTLEAKPGLYSDKDSHIFVKSKEEVIKQGIVSVLDEWVRQTPSALALRSWEREYEKARNALFADFYANSVYWPAILWKTFEMDGVSQSEELGLLISRNLLSRMEPFHLDMKDFMPKLEELKQNSSGAYSEAVRRVLEGERFVRSDRLQGDSAASGDVFKQGKYFFLNVRPDCDCISRSGEDPYLYLLKGCVLRRPEMIDSFTEKYGLFSERDNEAIVFPLPDIGALSFKFREITQKKWLELKPHRVGRILPPFSTRIQQRYSSYLQRPGLPRIPVEALPEDIQKAIEAKNQKIVPAAAEAAVVETGTPAESPSPPEGNLGGTD